MEISDELKTFINENINLINENSKESWEEIYKKLPYYHIIGKFTHILVSAEIFPEAVLMYIPDNYLFESDIQNYTILHGVTSIGLHAFYECDKLKKITIPDSVTQIKLGAFENCRKLDNIEIPKSVTNIGQSAFFGCTKLKNVYISDIEAWCNIWFDDASSSPLYYGADLYLNNNLLTKLQIPSTITKIKDNIFNGCTSLTEIIVPSSVINIGRYAFYGCNNVTSLTLGNNIRTIEDFAFQHCSSLKEITIPNSVTSISDCAFCDCSNLTTVIIPSSVRVIGEYLFANCQNLKELNFKGTKEQAIQLGIGNKLRKRWREDSGIERILCIDGVIEL